MKPLFHWAKIHNTFLVLPGFVDTEEDEGRVEFLGVEILKPRCVSPALVHVIVEDDRPAQDPIVGKNRVGQFLFLGLGQVVAAPKVGLKGHPTGHQVKAFLGKLLGVSGLPIFGMESQGYLVTLANGFQGSLGVGIGAGFSQKNRHEMGVGVGCVAEERPGTKKRVGGPIIESLLPGKTGRSDRQNAQVPSQGCVVPLLVPQGEQERAGREGGSAGKNLIQAFLDLGGLGIGVIVLGSARWHALGAIVDFGEVIQGFGLFFVFGFPNLELLRKRQGIAL